MPVVGGAIHADIRPGSRTGCISDAMKALSVWSEAKRRGRLPFGLGEDRTVGRDRVTGKCAHGPMEAT